MRGILDLLRYLRRRANTIVLHSIPLAHFALQIINHAVTGAQRSLASLHNTILRTATFEKIDDVRRSCQLCCLAHYCDLRWGLTWPTGLVLTLGSGL